MYGASLRTSFVVIFVLRYGRGSSEFINSWLPFARYLKMWTKIQGQQRAGQEPAPPSLLRETSTVYENEKARYGIRRSRDGERVADLRGG
jgi:hypothetical protein